MDEIDKLFNLMGIDFNAMVSTMVEDMKENAKKQSPDIPDSFWDSFWGKFRKELDNESPRNFLVDIYKRHFTDDEIAGLIKFYESPLGHKSAKVNQQITQETQAISVSYFESLGKEIAKELIVEDS